MGSSWSGGASLSSSWREGCARVYQADSAGGQPRLSVMQNGLGNLAAGTVSQLVTAMRHQLHRIRRQHSLITGFLGQTELALEPEPPDTQPLAFQAL
jgi:hypothetical protein